MALGRRGDPGEDLEQRGLAGTVAADDADDLPFGDLERNVAEGPEGLGGLCLTAPAPDLRRQLLAEQAGPVDPLGGPHPVELPEGPGPDGGGPPGGGLRLGRARGGPTRN